MIFNALDLPCFQAHGVGTVEGRLTAMPALRGVATRVFCVYASAIALTAGISDTPTKRGEAFGDMDFAASLSYREVYRIACPLGAPGSLKHEVGFHVESRVSHVRARDISVCIYDGENKTPLVVDEFGQFQLPMAKRLYSENPRLVFNQPKGTLTLECYVRNVRIRIPDSRALTYRELVGTAILPMTLAMLGNKYNDRSYPQELYFDLGEEVTGCVTIEGPRKTERIFLQEKSGILCLQLSENLMQVNPIVRFPEGSEYAEVIEGCRTPV